VGRLNLFGLALFSSLMLGTATVGAEETHQPVELALVDFKPDMRLGYGELAAGQLLESSKLTTLNLIDNLQAQFNQWRGTPHRMGGTDESGIDCSALVREILGRTVNVQLPRSSREQLQEGAPVSKTELRTGDLVFFNSGPSGKHVGIYMGEGRFLHTSSMLGVTISSLDNKYWKKRFVAARRVLTAAIR